MTEWGERTGMVRDYFLANPGRTLTVKEIAEHVGRPAAQISQCIVRVSGRMPGISKEGMGLYVYRPPGAQSKLLPGSVLEIIGHDNSGTCLARHESGEVYRLISL